MSIPTLTQLEEVRAILRRENPNEPSGEWSEWDIARELDPDADPASSTALRIAREAVKVLCPDGGRYVGGTSGHLYWLPAPE